MKLDIHFADYGWVLQFEARLGCRQRGARIDLARLKRSKRSWVVRRMRAYRQVRAVRCKLLAAFRGKAQR